MNKKIVASVILASLCFFAAAQGRRVTVRDFIKMADDDTTTCVLGGVVKSVRNPANGNLYLKDKTGTVLVYGIRDYRDYGVLQGDSLVLSGRRFVFNNTVVEMKDATVVRYAKGKKHDKLVEQMRAERNPSFKGGDMKTFSEWVQAHLRYPAEANGITGTVTISFAVGRNGRVQEVLVDKGVHPLLDAEAARVVSSSPKWKPAKRNGRPVRTALSIDVKFDL